MPEKLAAPSELRIFTQHVRLSDLPNKSDSFVARLWLVGALRNEDRRAGALALARLLRDPLDQRLRRVLAEEIELVARGKGRILRLKDGGKLRRDPLRGHAIALCVWERLRDMRKENASCTVDAALRAVASENALGLETVRKAWQHTQRKVKLPSV
jgi:hypothetical protein